MCLKNQPKNVSKNVPKNAPKMCLNVCGCVWVCVCGWVCAWVYVWVGVCMYLIFGWNYFFMLELLFYYKRNILCKNCSFEEH